MFFGCLITNIVSFERFINHKCNESFIETKRQELFEHQEKFLNRCSEGYLACGMSPLDMATSFKFRGYPVMSLCPYDERPNPVCVAIEFHGNTTWLDDPNTKSYNQRLNVGGCTTSIKLTKEQCLFVNRYKDLKTSGVPFIF